MPERLSSQSGKNESKGNSKIPIFQLFSEFIEIWKHIFLYFYGELDKIEKSN